MFLLKIPDFKHFKKNGKTSEFESKFFNTTTGGLKLNHYLVQCDVDLMIQFGLINKWFSKVTFNFTFCDESPIFGT